MKRILKWAAIVIVLLVLTIALLWWWLSGTRAGAEWVLGQVESRVEQMNWSALSGSLSDGLTVENLRLIQAGSEVEIERLELTVGVRPGMPLQVTIRRLNIDGLNVRLPPPGPPQEEPSAFELGDYSSPAAVQIRALLIRDAVIQPADAAPIVLQRLALAGSYHSDLRLERLELEAAPWRLQAEGQQGMAQPWASDLNLRLDWQIEPDTLQQLNLTTEGDLGNLSIDATTSGPIQAEADIQLEQLADFERLSGQIDLIGQLRQWPGLDLSLHQVELNAAGNAAEWEAVLSAETNWADWPSAVINVQAVGDDRSMLLQRSRIELLDGEIALSGQADWAESPRATARVEFNDLDFTGLYPQWPQQARLAGALDMDFDQDVLQIENLVLRAPPAALNLTGQARMDVQTQMLSTQLEWSALTWPPVLDSNETEPLFSSQAGTFKADGTLEEWQAELDALLTLPGRFNQPEAQLNLNANGDARQVRQFSGRLQSPQAGVLNLSGRAGFDGTLNANLNLQDFDPSLLAADWAGQISGELALTVDQPQPLSAALDITRLDGRLRNLPLSGRGGLSLRQQQISQADLAVSLGDNQLEVQSDNGRIWQVAVEASALNQLWPELSGELFLNGTVQPEQGTGQWQLTSDRIAWREFRARAVDLQAQAGWLGRPMLELELQASDVDLNPWERLDQFRLRFSGDCEQHAASLELGGSRAGLSVQAEGALSECLDDPTRWQGRISRLELTETAWGNWSLTEALAIAVEPERLTLGASCLQAEGGNSALCLQRLNAGASGQAALSLRELPIDLLLLPANPPFSISSALGGDLELRWAEAGLQSLEGELGVSRGALRAPYDERDLLTIEQIALTLDSPEPGSAQARVEALLQGETRLTAAAEVPDMADLASMRLDAQMNLDLPDLGAFVRLIPQVDELAGRVEGKLSISGPVTEPQINGELALREGYLLHAPLGSRIEQISLDLVADQTSARLQGRLAAGEGHAEIEGAFRDGVSGDGGWQGQLALDGENVQLFDVDWLRMAISPELEIGFNDEQLSLNGALAIDRARLGLPPGADQRIEPSPDVVIVNGRDEVEQTATPSEAVRDIVGQIQLSLGEDVRMQAAGMRTRLAGALDIQWQPETPLPIAQGQIELIDGLYSAYGQNLDVERGLVQFTGQPIDNPLLEIEAVRQIFGDTQVEQAGVRIRGAARNPEIVLFTSPPTSREKALAYVLTGADFDHAGGQGAFNVGLWVLPNVFVSYGLGLFDTGNVLAARWELSRRWGLRATSGERDTGADISFLIDR